jgi:hypothetical protein
LLENPVGVEDHKAPVKHFSKCGVLGPHWRVLSIPLFTSCYGKPNLGASISTEDEVLSEEEIGWCC